MHWHDDSSGSPPSLNNSEAWVYVKADLSLLQSSGGESDHFSSAFATSDQTIHSNTLHSPFLVFPPPLEKGILKPPLLRPSAPAVHGTDEPVLAVRPVRKRRWLVLVLLLHGRGPGFDPEPPRDDDGLPRGGLCDDTGDTPIREGHADLDHGGRSTTFTSSAACDFGKDCRCGCGCGGDPDPEMRLTAGDEDIFALVNGPTSGRRGAAMGGGP
ncbi:hypothetical protein MKZ38_007575 [Zalerion maritima]|uniref:Uncharacterized protein n=1 Tax=Zalerion maritima TaxID=339359 RepID=A0AAD5S2W6_9PEZI|nr:hypothetical protein MKZ38_007575 [Zalerion maritima]